MSAKAPLSADKRTSGAPTQAPPLYGYAAQGDALFAKPDQAGTTAI
jgi:hypothetical protein